MMIESKEKEKEEKEKREEKKEKKKKRKRKETIFSWRFSAPSPFKREKNKK